MTGAPTGSATAGSNSAVTRGLLVAGLIAGPLFVVTFLIAGALAETYNPIRQAVSLLALQKDGWIQTLNFLVGGMLLIMFAVGLARAFDDLGRRTTAGPVLIGVVGVGVLAAGAFAVPATLHYLASVLAFVGLPMAMTTFAVRFGSWGQQGWATYSGVSAVVSAVGVVLFVGFNGNVTVASIAGLIQRIVIIVGWGWMTLLAAELLYLRRIRAAHVEDPR